VYVTRAMVYVPACRFARSAWTVCVTAELCNREWEMYRGGGRRGGREGGQGGGARGAGGFAGGPGGRGGRGRGGGRDAGDGGGRGGGRIAAGARPVEEGMRINIKQLLEDFQASDEQGAQAPTPTTRTKGVLLYALGGLWRCIALRIDVDGRAASSTRRTRRAAISRALGTARHAEMAFPPNLDNHDRAVVHSECRKYGFTSRSYGCAIEPTRLHDWPVLRHGKPYSD
jgi:hypothetical protein